jgi:predicted amidohydrolase
MRLAGVQFDLVWEDVTENLQRAEDWVKEAAEQQVDLVVFPEMFATGFSMHAERVAAAAETIARWAEQAARRHGLAILAGYAEPGAERPANACTLFDRDGQRLLHYRKIHPFSLADEDQHFEGGRELPTVTLDGVRVTAVICYDLRFPEVFRAAAARTDLFLVPANWPAKRVGAWSTLLRARAIENQAFVLGVNRVGEGNGLVYSGDSVLLDPMGEAVAHPRPGAALWWGQIDVDQVQKVREKLGFLADRRPEVYAELEGIERSTPRS